MSDENMTIEQELLYVLDAKKQGKKEERSHYLKRITKECKGKWWADEVSAESDEEWEGLSDPVQEWVNNAVTAADSGEEIAEFPDFEEAGETQNKEEEEEMSEVTEEETSTKKSKKITKPEKTAKAAKANGKSEKSVKVAKEKPTKEPKVKSPRRFVREAVIKNPKITQEKLMQRLAEAGHSKISNTTVAAMRTSVLGVLRIARDMQVDVRELELE